jgi:hypothetical protein
MWSWVFLVLHELLCTNVKNMFVLFQWEVILYVLGSKL